MSQLGKYTISNTRGMTAEGHRVRVSRNGGELVAEVYPARLDPDNKGFSNPLRFVRRFPLSASRRAFVAQLKSNLVSDEDIKMLLSMEKGE